MATKTISAAGNVDLGDAGTGNVTTKVVQFTSNSLVGSSITVNGRLTGAGGAFVAIPYKRRSLAGAASDDTVVSTAITGSALIEVNAAGLEIRLIVTGYTSGSMTVDYVDLEG